MSDSNDLKELSSTKCFEGLQQVYEHYSNQLKCTMKFGAYLPSNHTTSNMPVLIWLSGLTCNETNFIQKSGFQKYAEKHKTIVINPDTSPRGCNIEDEAERWDFGVGAGFYVDATEPKWNTNFRMYSYVNSELHDVIRKNFCKNANDLKISIFGHSMGGHGSLISFFKNPNKYKSVSAFAPISNPTQCDWGKFAFAGYLGKDESQWKDYDATCLLKSYVGPECTILIDQGLADDFLPKGQLLPENLVEASKENKLVSIDLRNREGYDHGYYYISTFIEEHFDFHAEHLSK
jgi:S-formylglutathione hydrolase